MRIDLTPPQVAESIRRAGFGFMFAPAHHQATRYVVPVRRELAVRTAFNLLGPLTNPAGARRQLIGVSDAGAIDTVAGALALLGVDRALVVAGADGLDEISDSAPTLIAEVTGTDIERYEIDPAELPLGADGAAPAGGTPEDNAAVTLAIVSGAGAAGENLAAANAGAAIYAAGHAESIVAGVELARETIASGAAAGALERLVAVTAELAGAPA